MKTLTDLPSHSLAVCPQAGVTSHRMAALFESSNDAIIGQDLNGLITDWNQGAEKMFGGLAAEMMGAPGSQLIPADRQNEANDLLEKIRQGGNFRDFETLRQTKTGRLISVSLTVAPIRDLQGNLTGTAQIIRNLTVQKEHERELARLNRLYAASSQVNQAIVRMTTRDGLFQQVCQVLVEHGGFHMAWIGWHDAATHQLVPVAVWGEEKAYIHSIKIYGDERPEGGGPSGLAFRTGRPCVCNDMLNNPVTLPWRPELMRRGFHASAGIPIRCKNEVVGTLTIYSDYPWFFQDKEINLLEETAADISFALDNLADKEARRQVEAAVLNEKNFSDTMIESLPGILYFYDEQGRFVRWNRNFEIVSGYSGGEIARMHPLDFFPDNEKEMLKLRIAEVFAKGESSVEASFVSRNGQTTPYFLTGRRTVFNGTPCLVGVGVDISERKCAEQKLRETQGQLEAVVENLREGLVISDPGGEWLHWNPASLRMLGFADLHEGLSRQREFGSIFELYTLDGAKLPLDQWPLGRVRRGESIDNLEIRVRRPGTNWERIFSYSGTLVRYAGDQTLAFMTLHDITERQRAEMALRVLNQTLELEVTDRTSDLQAALVRAEAADRIKSAFLATMSHELRTPLNSIIGFTGIVLQGLAGPLNDEQSKQLGMVRTSARHLLELINDVLDLSKIEAGQLEVRAEPFNLRASLERVTALVLPLAEKKGLALSVLIPPAIGEMMSDRRRVEQILLNLVNNAIKFTEQGRVTITAEAVTAYQSPAALLPQPAVRLRVTDNGIGIKPEDLADLFQPFHQVETGFARQHEGTGLGLVICRRLATLLGGEIFARSEWLHGSEFTVILPVQSPAAS